MSVLLAAALYYGLASELEFKVVEDDFEIYCQGVGAIDDRLVVSATNESEQVFLSNGTWIYSKIDGAKLIIREYDGNSGASIVRHLWSLSGYKGSKDLVFFHARARGESFIYWRELTSRNSYQHGLMRYRGIELTPLCSDRAVLQSRDDFGPLD